MTEITGNYVDVIGRQIYGAKLTVRDGRIAAITPTGLTHERFLMPGFVDAHVHIESSMLTPGAFAAAAVVHGTLATVNDPHEIANVMGLDGVRFMLAEAARVPLKFCFGAPSCVPATAHETAGGELDIHAVRELLAHDQIGYLAEMMNWPGVLAGDPTVMAKIQAARDAGKSVDGHAPGLRGDAAAAYHAAGIDTDHECFTHEEALDKLAAGAKILIREGSAARNLAALWTLIDSHPGRVMLCSDDKHPHDLIRGHINELCARLIAMGADLFNILLAACVVPVAHYKLDLGLLGIGQPADLIEVDDLTYFNVRRAWLDGQLVAEDGRAGFTAAAPQPINRFRSEPTRSEDYRVDAKGEQVHVIVVSDGQIVTRRREHPTCVVRNNGSAELAADLAHDVIKIAVVNRYDPKPPAVALVQGFGIRRGAIAGSVAHDSHNVIAVGAEDDSLCRAVNRVIANQGGLVVVDGETIHDLPLEVAGLMSTREIAQVAGEYEKLEAAARGLGSPLAAPFMTLSFMALLVIPSLKLSDRGLFDGDTFSFVPLFV